MQNAILAPAAVLIAWTLIMLCWLAMTRLPALAKANLPAEQTRGGRGIDLDGILPAEIQWKSHNYNHLMEQPTIFYALIAILAIAGAGQADIYLAWAYVGLRIVHSIWQAQINTIPVRLSLFFLSSLILIIMTARALMVTF